MMFWALALAMEAATPSPDEAAGAALMQCVSHASGMVTIESENAAALAGNGLTYQADAPVQLRSMASTPYGTGRFARSRSTAGDVWAVGYDRGACIVMVLGVPVDSIERRLKALFDIPNVWQPEAINQIGGPDIRWSQYGWDVDHRRLTAQMKVQPLLQTPVKGLVMVTISPEAKEKTR